MIDLSKYVDMVVCATLLSGQRIMGMIRHPDSSTGKVYSIEYPYELMINPQNGQLVMGDWQPFSSAENSSTDINGGGLAGITTIDDETIISEWKKRSGQVEILTPPKQSIIMT